MIRTLLDSGHPFLQGITLERLEREHSVRLNVAPGSEPYLPFAHGGFGTPSGKCEFGAEALDYQPPIESRLGAPELRARFPLELISAKSHDSMNSTFGNDASAKSRRPRCSCMSTMRARAESRMATACASSTSAAVVLWWPKWMAWCGPAWSRALGALEQAGVRPSQHQRAHLRPAHRHRRRSHVLQLSGGCRKVRRLTRGLIRAQRQSCDPSLVDLDVCIPLLLAVAAASAATRVPARPRCSPAAFTRAIRMSPATLRRASTPWRRMPGAGPARSSPWIFRRRCTPIRRARNWW